MGLVSLLLGALLAAAPAGFSDAPAFLRLFTPKSVPPGTYRTFASPEPLEAALAAVRDDPTLSRAPGAFEPQWVGPGDAFGQSGGYNRWKLALVYGARRARVARGPRIVGGRVVEAWTLVSPYPDAALERLNEGTLLIVLQLPS